MLREEAKAKLKNFADHCYPNEEFLMAIQALEAEPKTGHWIEVTNGRGGHECDLCHEYAPSYQDGDEYLTKYCPNCGAEMVEPQKRSDKE